MKHFILASLILYTGLSAYASQDIVLASCPPERPLLSKKGGCFACDDPMAFDIEFIADCSNLCQKQDGTYIRKSNGAECHLAQCPAGTTRKKHFDEHCITQAPCPPDKPLLSENGECYACDYPNKIKLKNESDCETKCMVDGKPIRNQNFWGCSLNDCPEGATKNAFEECLFEPTSCPPSHPLREGKHCYSCQYQNVVDMAPDDIEKCLTACVDENNQPTRKIYRNAGCGVASCPADKPLLVNGQCFACDTTDSFKTKNCDICADQRTTITYLDKEYCALKTCPADKPLRMATGNCISCDEQISVIVPKGTCTKTCPNRVVNNESFFYLEDEENTEECNHPEETFIFLPNDDEIKIKRPINNCPTDKPLQDYQGGCYACDNPSLIYANETECTKCVNRQAQGTWSHSNRYESHSGIICGLK